MKKLIVLPLLVAALSLSAQKKTTYFPNGNKQFEGSYTMTFGMQDARDFYESDTAGDRRKIMSWNMITRMANRAAMPQRVYDGQCTFYYENGQPSFGGTYEHGVKNGLFTYWYYDGKKEAEYKFVNGMADGEWKGWYKNGKVRLTQSYTALARPELDSMYTSRMAMGRPMHTGGLIKGRGEMRQFANDSLKKAAEKVLPYFEEMETGFFANSHWNGDFNSYYENGAQWMEMHYKHDVRVGNWAYMSDDGKVLAELHFTDGKISKVLNNLPPDAGRPLHNRPGGGAFEPGARPTGGKYRAAQVKPVPGVDLQQFLRDNTRYPGAAKAAHIQGMVLVRFTVNEDGSTDDYEVVRGLGNGCDEEAIRVVKSIPSWQPGKTDGKPVTSTHMVPVQFRPEPVRMK